MCRMNPQLWFRRVLGICPVLVAVLWIAGVAHFRDYSFTPLEWGVLAACAFALHILGNLLRRPRPLPKLPEGANPVWLSAQAAAILAVLVAMLAGVAEWLAEPYHATDTPWALRTLWYAACAFAASYCTFLLRLTLALEQGSRPPAPRR